MRMGSLEYRHWTRKEVYLYKLGGRTAEDVWRDEKGEFVWMWDGRYHDWVKSRLPIFEDEWLYQYDSH